MFGIQLTDLEPDLGTARGGVEHNAASTLQDSDQLARGMAAPTADSASYDTDMDFQHFPGSQPCKIWTVTAKTVDPSSRQHGFLDLLFCHGHRAPTADGEGPDPPPSYSCGDFLRFAVTRTRTGLSWLRKAAVQTTTASSSGNGSQGVFYSLVCRQVSVSWKTWEAYQVAMTERQGMSRAAPKARRSVFGLPVLHPQCSLAIWWSSAMLLFDLVFTAFWVPVNVAFCLDQYGKLGAACTRTDLAGGIIYLVNILFNFQVGVTITCGYRFRLILDGRDAARLYFTNTALWLDLLAVVPFVYLIIVLGLGDSVTRHQVVSIISLMRLVRLSRVASIVKQLYISSSGGEFESSWLADHFTVTPVYAMLLMYVAMVLANLYACVLLLIAYYERRDGKLSWMNSVTWQDVPSLDAPRQWYNALYFAITVMTTTGYADFVPKSPVEQGVASVMTLNGLLIFGALVALIGSALKRSQAQAQRVHDSRRKLSNIRRWLQEEKLPEGMQRDVITFFSELDAKKDEGRSEGDIVFELPAHLRQKVVRHVLLDLLALCPPLAGLAPEVRELIAAQCVPLELPTGHELFRLGDDVEGGSGGGGMWILEEGVVWAQRFQELVEAPAGRTGLSVPCLLGEGALLGDVIPACSRRLWTICTERPCRVWQLRAPALHAVLRVYPHLVQHLMMFVRDRVLTWLSSPEESEDDGWCEMVQLLKRSFIMGPLQHRIHDCYLALQLASLPEGTLVQLLAAWLDMSAPRDMSLQSTEQPPLYNATKAIVMAQGRARAGGAAEDKLVTPAATPAQPASPAASDDGGGGGFANFAGRTGGGYGGLPVGAASERLSKGDSLGVAGVWSGGGGGGGDVGDLGADSGSRMLPMALPAASSLYSGADCGGAAAAVPAGSMSQSERRQLLSDDERCDLVGALELLSPSVEKVLQHARSTQPPLGRGRGTLSKDGSQDNGQIRRTCSAGELEYGTSGAAIPAAGTAAGDSPSPGGSGDRRRSTAGNLDAATGGVETEAADGGDGSAAAAAVALSYRSSAPVRRGLTGALDAVRTAAEAVTAGQARCAVPYASPFSTLATAASASADAASTAGGGARLDSVHQLLLDLTSNTPSSPPGQAPTVATRAATATAAQPHPRVPTRTVSCVVLEAGRGGTPANPDIPSRGRGAAAGFPAGSQNLAAVWSGGGPGIKPRPSAIKPRPGEVDLAAAPLPAAAALLSRQRAHTVAGPLPGRTQLDAGSLGGISGQGGSREGSGQLGSPAAPRINSSLLTGPGREGASGGSLRLLSDGGGGSGGGATVAAATAPALAAGSPRDSMRRHQEAPMAPGAAAQDAAAVALTRPNPNSHTTFIHKIFLSAGVVLQPTPSLSSASQLAVGAGAGAGMLRPDGVGGAGAVAVPGAVQGGSVASAPTILAPACATCGCATCAYCARPIVPLGAVSSLLRSGPTVSAATMAAVAAPQEQPRDTGVAATGATASPAVLLQAASGSGLAASRLMPSGRSSSRGLIDSGAGGGDGSPSGVVSSPLGATSQLLPPVARPGRQRNRSMAAPAITLQRSWTRLSQQSQQQQVVPPAALLALRASNAGERRPMSPGTVLTTAATAVSETGSPAAAEPPEDGATSTASGVRLGGTMCLI